MLDKTARAAAATAALNSADPPEEIGTTVAAQERRWNAQVDRAFDCGRHARTRTTSPYQMPRGVRDLFIAATESLTSTERMRVFDALDETTQTAFWDDLRRQVQEARGEHQ